MHKTEGQTARYTTITMPWMLRNKCFSSPGETNLRGPGEEVPLEQQSHKAGMNNDNPWRAGERDSTGAG